MTEENKQDNVTPPQLYEAKEAAEYLSRKWGIPYNTASLKKLRQRRGIQPYIPGAKSSFYSKDQLDAMPKPGTWRKKKRGTDEDRGGRNSSVTYPASSYAPAALGAVS